MPAPQRISTGLGRGVPILAFDFREHVQGHPGYLHGGTMSTLMEMAAYAALIAQLGIDGTPLPMKPANITIDYLRSEFALRTFASGEVVRAGRRLALVRASAWQQNPSKPVATALLNIILSHHG